MRDYKVIVSGSRDFNDYDFLNNALDTYFKSLKGDNNIIFVLGMSQGADRLGERYAQEHGYTVERHNKESTVTHGSKRNVEMTDKADALVAFWDGKSLGTKHLINAAKEKGLSVKVVRYH